MSDARPSRAKRAALGLAIGPGVWAVHFLGIYGIAALGCARLPGAGAPGPVVPAIAAATLLAGGALVGTIVHALRSARRGPPSAARAPFVHWLTAALAAIALVAVVWQVLPALLVPACV
jgi:hypothetical protein